MKKLMLLTFLSFFLFKIVSAQEPTTGKSVHSFKEWNFGLASVSDLVFPGTSFLWGKTFINENNTIFEYQAGFAFPTIVTGKIGVGKKFNDINVIVGVRPFPFQFYLQSSFKPSKKGYWITSIEFNPFSSSNSELATHGILNFGYRWNINQK